MIVVQSVYIFVNRSGLTPKSPMTSLYADVMPSENGRLANMIRNVG
jgi:hypothetical protein